jgi:hypothetical protein
LVGPWSRFNPVQPITWVFVVSLSTPPPPLFF